MNLPAQVPIWLKILYPQRVWQMQVKEKVLFISFDDGPHESITPQVLDLLKSHGAKATFFCLGKNIIKNPSIFERILSEGHAVGNHGHQHLNGWSTNDDAYIEDVMEADKLIQSNLFRPPYGRLKSRQAKHLKEVGFQIIMWSLLSADYDRRISKEACAMRILKHLKPGKIILLHDSEKAAVNMLHALEALLEYALKRGYRFEAMPYKKGSA